jgi:hypothetical protein
MSDRKTPYKLSQMNWGSILDKILHIPMNQRSYSWDVPEIEKFIKDIIKLFEENKYVEKMGSIINLNYNKINDIYDGQQRIITIILILFAISLSSSNLYDTIISKLTINTIINTLTPNQEKLKNELNVLKIPRLYCTNPYDRKALTLILNKKYKPFTYFINNLYDFDFEDTIELTSDEYDYISFQCICGANVNRKSDFITHLKTTHKSKDDEYTECKDSKIYKAFEVIISYITSLPYSDKKYIELYKFITESIDIAFYDCDDPEYVSRMFEWDNNRGKNVEAPDIIKNLILVKIPDDKKYEVYDEWERLKKLTHIIYKKDYGQKLFDIAIQIYNKSIQRKINQDTAYKSIINSDNTYKEINILFKIILDLDKIMKEIQNDRFGKLIMSGSGGSITWEGVGWGWLPIFYITEKIDTNLIRLFVNFYFRNLGFKNKTFNPMSYSEKFISICNEVLKNPSYDYYTKFKECLYSNMDISVIYDNYIKNACDISFNTTNAKQLLSFIETVINNNNYILPSEPTLEHIYPQKAEKNLSLKSNINLLGNLTLLEGKNDDGTGHKGNSSLKDKEFSIKKKSYKGSSFKITRNIEEDYRDNNLFTEADIKNRTEHLAFIINENTIY